MELMEVYIRARAWETEARSLDFVQLLEKAVRSWDLPVRLRHQLRCMIGQDAAMNDMLACDTRLRVVSQDAMVQTLVDYWLPVISKARSMFFLTFADDRGITSDRTPNLRCSSLQQKVAGALKGLGLSAVVQTEIQGLMNYPQKGHGRLLLTNSHAIAWGDVSPRTISRKVGELNRSSVWTNHFGVKPILCREMKDGLADLVVVAHYIDKLPVEAKNLFKSKLYETMAGYRPEFALRLFEALSYLRLPDIVMGIGEGQAVRDTWECRVAEWQEFRQRIDRETPFLPMREFWRLARAENGSQLFKAFKVA
ncbi:hypothetical protein SAMN06295920_110126 [Rhizorhabdus histidinilytica]|uniref:Uncharacterized protein n=2 Tax=Rhizorhabdus histidinilytica TaxID=439228 RepID=A0A1T5FPY5_9SPHN|nr:hypothetical protein SAMN06295920_110126 [Rhizorhabdus histidinilytica]